MNDRYGSESAVAKSHPLPRKALTVLLICIIVTAMIVWIGLLGWGAIAVLHWVGAFTQLGSP